MAKNDKIDINALTDRLRKSFGSKTKMPSNANNEEERSQAQLVYSQMIMGSLASLIWGEKSVTKEDKVKSLLGHKNNIYDLVESIKQDIKTINNGAITVKLANNTIKAIIDTPIIVKLLDEDIINILSKTFNSNKKINELNKKIDNLQGNLQLLNLDINKLKDIKANIDELIVNVSKIIIKGKPTIDYSDMLNQIEESFNIETLDGFKSLNELLNDEFVKNFNIFDETIAKHIPKVEQLFDLLQKFDDQKTNIIYIDIQYETIADSIKKLKEKIKTELYNSEIFKQIDEDINERFNKSITINIDTEISQKIKDFIDSLAIDDTKLKQTQKGINSLNEIINSLTYITFNFDKKTIDTIHGNIDSLINIFSDSQTNTGFPKLFEKIGAIINQSPDTIKDISNINSTLQTLITVISIDPKIINLKGLRTLVRISDNNGLIRQLLDNLSEITKGDNGANINNKSFHDISSFFNMLSEIGNIGFIKRMIIKSNIRYFSEFIGTDIPKLIDELSKESKKTISSEQVKNIYALASIFTALTKIGELDFKHKIRMKFNLMFIRYFIIDDVINLLKDICDSINNVTPEVAKTLEQINALFDKIFTIGDKSIFSFAKLSINLSILGEIIKDQLVGSKEDNNGIIYSILSINKIDLNKAINKIQLVGDLVDIISDIISNDSLSLKNSLFFIVKLFILNQSIEPIRKLIDGFKTFDGRTLNGVINKTKKLSIIFNDISNFGINPLGTTLLYVSLKIEQKNVALMKNIIDSLNEITPKKSIEKVLNYISLLCNIKVSISSAFALKKSLGAIKGSIKIIKDICDELSSIDTSKLKEAQLVIGTFNNILLKAAAILIIGGLAMRYINPVELIAFTVTLGAFLWGITKVFSLMSKTINKDIKISKDAMNLVLISGGILILGGLFMNLINPIELITFAVTLGLFMLMTSGAYMLFSRTSKDVFASAKDFAYLIMVSAGVLMFGALFMKTNLWIESIKFAVLLISFITLVTFVYKLVSKNIESSLHAAKELSTLIAISAMTLMIGALFVSDLKRLAGALLFSGILIIFIGGILAIFKWASKHIKTALSTMLAISALITIAATTLLIGGLLFTLFPKLFGNVMLFGLTLVIFVGLIGLLCVALNHFKDKIIPGILVMGGIIILMGLAAVALGLLAITAWLIDNVGWLQTIGTVALIVGIFGGLSVLCGIIGQPEVAMFVGLGIVVMGAMTILLYLMIGAIAALVAVIKYASTIDEEAVTKLFGKGLIDTGIFVQAIWGLVKLAPAFIALSVVSAFMMPGIAATFALSAALVSVAKTIQTWADLKIPEYGPNGKIIGYKTIDDTAFQMAAYNIKKVLTTLFGAVKTVYDDNKDLFNMDWNTLLTGKNPIQRVISSSTKMGEMLANIAYGIKSWAKLTIPEYGPNGKLIGYKTIDDSAFAKAAENIKTVITCLGQAIIDVYKEGPEGMFESKEWFGLGNTPFAKVTKALKTMGPMLSSIAHGIKDWAELKIPIYSGTKITGYKNLTNDDFQTAQENIMAVVTALANGIIQVYYDNDGMFEDDSWHGLGDSPFAKVTKALKTMGGSLGNIADAVKSWAELKIPIYGDSKDATKITGYQTIDNNVFIKVSDNIGYVVCALAKSIASLANDSTYGKYFTEGDFWSGNTPVVKVLKSIQPMGSALKDIADAIKAWSELKIPEYGDPKNGTKITGYKQLTPTDIENAKKNIIKVVKGLVYGVAQVYHAKFNDGTPMSKFFDNGGLFGTGDSPIEKVLNVMNPIGKSLKNISDAVKSWSELKVPIYDGNSLKPTGYMSIGGTKGINQAITNIKTVISSIVNALVDVYNGDVGKETKMKGKDLFKKDNDIIKYMIPAILEMSNMVSKFAKGIADIAALKIPIYDAKGNITGYNNIENGNFNKVGEVINSVLTAIGNAIIEVASNDKLDPKKNSNFKNVVESIKYSTDILSNMADIIGNYASGKFVIYKIKNDKLVPEKTININEKNFKTKIEKNIGIVLDAIGIVKTKILGKDYKGPIFASDINNIKKRTVFGNLLFNYIGNLIKDIDNFYKIINENNESLTKFNSSNFNETLGGIIEKINSIVSTINGNQTFYTNLETLSSKTNLTKYVSDTYNILNALFDNIIKLSAYNNKLNNISFEKLSGKDNPIAKFISAINDIKNINQLNSRKLNIAKLVESSKNLVELYNNFANLTIKVKNIDVTEFDKLTTYFEALYNSIDSKDFKFLSYFIKFYNSINNYIEIIKKYDGKVSNRVNSLKDGILNIYNITKAISSNPNFRKHTEELKKYIETINSIDLSKLEKMQNLVDALNSLGSKFDNLDSLTEAIADRLTAVLYELVQQLNKADTSINNAHQLQEKRKKLIDESMDKISNLMNQHMIVEITQTKEDNTGNTTDDKSLPEGKINGESTSSDTALGNNWNSIPGSSKEEKLQSPEAQQTVIKSTASNSDLDEFKNFMKGEYMNELKKLLNKE